MSEEKISKKEIEHLKSLARVQFGEKETEDLVGDLEKILDFVEQLKEVDISNVPEMTHAADLKNVFRKDENPKEFDEQLVGNLISAFPEKEKTYLKVKAVIKK
ncbi:MAG TPA: Asp-tRNA(Asn)/Glu-tRNA(Gln) amidotransferase subunit GatC [Candidatus Paceibacterota bacterium]